MIHDDVTELVNTVYNTAWNMENAHVVPTTDSVALSNGAKQIDATYVYSDLADSTKLARVGLQWAVAKVIRSYVNTAAAVLKYYGGEIRSFDGDRVMAIFIGSDKNDQAVRAGLTMSWAMNEVLRPSLQRYLPQLAEAWSMSHGVGIDTGEGLIVRGGVRGKNDLIYIGRAPNIAAKLSAQRGYEPLLITREVYVTLDKPQWDCNGVNIWNSRGSMSFAGADVSVFGTTYQSLLS